MPAGLRLWYPWRVAQLRRPQPPGDRLERGSLCRPTCRCRSAHQQPTPWKLSCRWSSPGRRDPGSIPTGGAAVIGRTVGGGTWIATDVSGRFLALGALILRHDARATSCVPSGIRSGRMVVGGSDDPDCGVAVQSACRDRSGRETHRVQLLAFLRPLPHQVDRSAERPAPRLGLHSPRARVRLMPSSTACQRPRPADDPVRHARAKGRPAAPRWGGPLGDTPGAQHIPHTGYVVERRRVNRWRATAGSPTAAPTTNPITQSADSDDAATPAAPNTTTMTHRNTSR